MESNVALQGQAKFALLRVGGVELGGDATSESHKSFTESHNIIL